MVLLLEGWELGEHERESIARAHDSVTGCYGSSDVMTRSVKNEVRWKGEW